MFFTGFCLLGSILCNASNLLEVDCDAVCTGLIDTSIQLLKGLFLMVGRIGEYTKDLKKMLEMEIFFLSPGTHVHAQDLLLEWQGAAIINQC